MAYINYRPRLRTPGTITGATQLVAFTASSVTGLTGWWKADAQSYANNASVTSFVDSSGNGNNLTAASGNPTFKTNQINGYPAISFASGNHLDNTSVGFAASAFTVIFAISYTSGSFPAFLAEYNSTTAGYLALGGDNAAAMAISRTGQATSSSNLAIGGGYEICTYKSAGVSAGNVTVTPYRNGVVGSADLTLTSLSTNTNMQIGASKGASADFFVGFYAEILWYNSALADGDRSFVENYLKSKYAIT